MVVEVWVAELVKRLGDRQIRNKYTHASPPLDVESLDDFRYRTPAPSIK